MRFSFPTHYIAATKACWHLQVFEQFQMRYLFPVSDKFRPKYILDAGRQASVMQLPHQQEVCNGALGTEAPEQQVQGGAPCVARERNCCHCAGGNAGFSTMLFKLLWPEAMIVTLEPDASNFAMLKRNNDR